MDDVTLPPIVQEILTYIEELFTVGTVKLKQISNRFKKGLGEGLQRDGANIVST